MTWDSLAPWVVFAVYGIVTTLAIPRRVGVQQFFNGGAGNGAPPGVWLVAASAAITWIFAKSIVNVSDLSLAFGPTGAIGYTIYYLSFVVAGVTIYLLRVRGGYRSLMHYLVDKYGGIAARLFLLVVGFRLLNEVWSNTKVMALYFGPEGSTAYWLAAAAVTLYTLAYAWSGGMRASLMTDRLQTLLIFVLLGVVLAVLLPGLQSHGVPPVPADTEAAGMTFCLLALVQIWSYPFHDPVLTDRGFLNSPRQMLQSFLLAAVLSGGFILLFGLIGLYGRAFGLSGQATVSVPASFGLLMLMLFNGMMLLSGGSTIDSTFTSVAKLAARDWRNAVDDPTASHLRIGRVAVLVVAIVGNLPLLTLYLGDRIGPAVIAATTISGTMVIGLAPIFLLGWLRSAGTLSFHLAFWPGLIIGVTRAVETFAKVSIFPPELAVGSGRYALDLGVNLYGLLVCTIGFLLGALLTRARSRQRAMVEEASIQS